MKKITLFLVLPLLFTVLLLGGCGKEEQVLLNDSLTGVFRETVIPLPENYTVSDGLSFRDGRFSAPLYFTDDGGETSYVTKNRQTISFDPDGGNVLIEPFDSIAASTETWDIGDVQFVSDERFILTMSANGQPVAAVDLPLLFDYDIDSALKNQSRAPVSFEIRRILEKDGIYYILTSNGLCTLTSDGNLRWSRTMNDNPIDLLPTEAGLLCLAGWSGAVGLFPVNEADGSYLEEVLLPDCIRFGGGIGTSLNDGVKFYDGDDTYALYIANEFALWGMTTTVDENGVISCTATECVNWLNSDIAPATLSGLCPAGDTVLTAIREIDGVNALVLLTKVPEEELSERKILTLAILGDIDRYYSEPIRALMQAIETFNRTGGDYRIIVTDFSMYEEDVRLTFFNAEMAAGRVPDIVLLPYDANVDTYERSGIFTDLLPLMRADAAFDDEGLLGYVTTPYLRDGKQYIFPLAPSVYTQFGSTAYFDGPITAEEIFAVRDALPEGTYLTKQNIRFKSGMLAGSLNDFVDYSNATCSFDDGRLANILAELASVGFTPTPDELRERNAVYFALRDGTLRLTDDSVNSLYQFFQIQTLTGGAVAVGYPNERKLLYIEQEMDVYFTVTEACEDKAVAFGLLNEILAAYEDLYVDGNYAFFESDVRRQFERYAAKTFVMEGNRFTYYDDGDEKLNGAKGIKMTEADAQAYIDFLNSIDALLPTNTAIYAIYDEECWSELPRTPEEVADVIQSRVSILLSESYG